MKKYKMFILISICTLLFIASGTYAWYIWESNEKAIVNIDVCTPRVHFSGGATINANNIVPVLDKKDGLKKEINIYLNKGCDSTALMNLYMTVDELSSGLRDETFVYELYKGEELITSGNFLDKMEGDTITLAVNEVINEKPSIYTLYIYIDGTRVNPKTMQNQTFRFSLYSEGTGAIYKENVIANTSIPSSADSEFLNTGLIRKDIQSITIGEDNTVPEGVIGSKDISSKGDGSVMMWYKDIDNNNLYEVYIGGDGGQVKANTNGEGMFAYLTNAESLDLSNLDTSNITTMRMMFRGNSNLKKLDLSSLNTSNVVDMDRMFSECPKLKTLDLSSFDTSNVTNMQGLFYKSEGLTSVNLSSFNTSNVTTMLAMFYNCYSLKTLDLSNFNTSNVTDMSTMFYKCSALINLNVSSFDTQNVTKMQYMFNYCSSLTSLDLSNFNTRNVTNMSGMFQHCSSLTALDVSNFNTQNVTDMSYMFNYCSSLTSLDLSSFNTSNVTTMRTMFQFCSSLTSLDLSGFNTSNVTDMSYMLQACTALRTLDFRQADFSSVINYESAFSSVYLITLYIKDDIQKEWIRKKVTVSSGGGPGTGIIIVS